MKRKNFDIENITRYLLTRSGKEKEMIDKIIKDDEESRKEFDSYVEIWEKSANLKNFDDINEEEGWEKVKSRINLKTAHPKILMKGYMIRIAAVILLAAGLMFFAIKMSDITGITENVYTEFVTGNEPENITLSDGSIIYLNKNSKIIYSNSFGIRNRDVILEGEAFFDVARNEKLHFKIHGSNTIVEVLGTTFNVKIDSTVSVGVVSGKVSFYESGNISNRVELLPEHTGIYSPSTKQIVQKDYFDRNIITWHTHEFVFRNEPLKNVCQTLADYYNLKLEVSEGVKFVDFYNNTVTAGSLDSILFSINYTLTEDIQLIVVDDVLLVRKN